MAYVTTDLQGIRQKISPGNLRKGKYAMANQMLADMNPFVPADQYTMRQTGFVSSDLESIVWWTPYAKAQFYGTNGKVVFRNYTTPGTGKRWDLVAQGLYMNQWLKVFERGLKL